MNDKRIVAAGEAPPAPLDQAANLQTVLEAWHGATMRLERTHDALRSEVARLTAELELKNRQLARKNRLADLGQISSHVAHEVRNSLVPVTLYLSLLRRRLSDDRGSLDVLAKVEAGFVAVDSTVNDLLHFAAEREPRREPVSPAELVDDICSGLAPQLVAQGIELQLDIPRQATLWADRELLRRAVLNLVLNAIDAMHDGGELVISGAWREGDFELEVADSGPGLNDEALRHAFEPFFSTKRGGTGLGLSIVYRVAETHDGSVSAMNCPEGGAAFTLRIPTKPAARLRMAA